MHENMNSQFDKFQTVLHCLYTYIHTHTPGLQATVCNLYSYPGTHSSISFTPCLALPLGGYLHILKVKHPLSLQLMLSMPGQKL